MVEDLFFCATLTGRRGGYYTTFVQAGAEISDTGVEVVKADSRVSWEGIPRGWVSGMKTRSLVGLSNHSAFHRWSALNAARRLCCCCQMNGKIVRWCRMQASGYNSQGVVDDWVNKAGGSTAAPGRSTLLCGWMWPWLRWILATLLLQHLSPSQRAVSRVTSSVCRFRW